MGRLLRAKSSHAEVEVQREVAGILKDAESEAPVADLLRQHGVSKATSGGASRGGAPVSDVKSLLELEAENVTLKRMYVNLALRQLGGRQPMIRGTGHTDTTLNIRRTPFQHRQKDKMATW